MLLSYSLRSSYVHAKISWNSLKSWMYWSTSSFVQVLPSFKNFGFSRVPMSTLWVSYTFLSDASSFHLSFLIWSSMVKRDSKVIEDFELESISQLGSSILSKYLYISKTSALHGAWSVVSVTTRNSTMFSSIWNTCQNSSLLSIEGQKIILTLKESLVKAKNLNWRGNVKLKGSQPSNSFL